MKFFLVLGLAAVAIAVPAPVDLLGDPAALGLPSIDLSGEEIEVAIDASVPQLGARDISATIDAPFLHDLKARLDALLATVTKIGARGILTSNIGQLSTDLKTQAAATVVILQSNSAAIIAGGQSTTAAILKTITDSVASLVAQANTTQTQLATNAAAIAAAVQADATKLVNQEVAQIQLAADQARAFATSAQLLIAGLQAIGASLSGDAKQLVDTEVAALKAAVSAFVNPFQTFADAVKASVDPLGVGRAAQGLAIGSVVPFLKIVAGTV